MATMMPLMILLLVTFMASSPLIVPATIPDQPTLPTSTISAAPSLLPDSPSASPPALSPDVTPLFPSPGGSELSPSESSLPTIPSSPSPPNPDAMEAPGPVVAFSPLGSLPVSSSLHLRVSGLPSSIMVVGFLAFLLV